MTTRNEMIEMAAGFKSLGLNKATHVILSAIDNTVSNYRVIGETLAEILEGKLYKEDFETFDAYCNEMFHFSRSTAYRMISVSRKIYCLESHIPPAERYFGDFPDTLLAALCSVGDYETIKSFCNAHDITAKTPVAKVRKLVRAWNRGEEIEADGETVKEKTTPTKEKTTPTKEKTTPTKEPVKISKNAEKALTYLHDMVDICAELEKAVENGDIKVKSTICYSEMYNQLSAFVGTISGGTITTG